MKQDDFEFKHRHNDGVTRVMNMCDVYYKGQLRFSIALETMRGNFGQYMERIGCTPMELLKDAAYYGELAVMIQDCFMLECERPLNQQGMPHLQHYSSGVIASGIDFSADRELSDADKFMCALIVCDHSDYGLTSKLLAKLFGWSTYKSRKVAASVRHKYVGTLISEDREGYFGKGWMMERAMHTLISNYEHEVRESRKASVQAFFSTLDE